ncbi:MAG TPA: DUF4157 domain-containing protein [Candidatus Methanoperedens sp.]
MNERMSLVDKMAEVKSQNPVPQIRRKTESSQSMNSPVDRILFLQRTIGNQAVQRLIKTGALQAKLRIGQPGDIYEQEADRVAEQVMRTPDVSSAKDTRVQRKCLKCLKSLTGLLGKDKKDENLQTKETSGQTPEVTTQVETNINALKGGGQPLPESTRAFYEERFGYDFSQVRVHADAKAAEAAQAVNARAYTVGKDVVFGTGQYTPDTIQGKNLLAHELTHVLQQNRMYYRSILFRKAKKQQTRPPGVSQTLTIVLSGLSHVRPSHEVVETIREAIEPLSRQVGRELRFRPSGSGDISLAFDAGGNESRPCGFLILGVEGGGDIFVGAHEDLRVCCGPIFDPITREIDYITQILRVFEPDEAEFGRFVGNTAVHELGHIMSQLDHVSSRDNFMATGNLPRNMRTQQNMRRYWAGRKTFSSDQITRLVQAIRNNQFTGGMQLR